MITRPINGGLTITELLDAHNTLANGLCEYQERKELKNLLDGFTNISIENFDEGNFPRKLSLVINKKK